MAAVATQKSNATAYENPVSGFLNSPETMLDHMPAGLRRETLQLDSERITNAQSDKLWEPGLEFPPAPEQKGLPLEITSVDAIATNESGDGFAPDQSIREAEARKEAGCERAVPATEPTD